MNIPNKSNLSITPVKIFRHGDEDDGVIGIAAKTKDKNIIEISYFYGKTRPKNIIVISSQAGCASKCKFCEMGGESFIRNLTKIELLDQVKLMQEQINQINPHSKSPGKKTKVTFANVGEPLLNPNLILAIKELAKENFSFKISSIFPNSQFCKSQFKELAEFTAQFNNSVQIQISLISTNQKKRNELAGINLASFKEIQELGNLWKKLNPTGRKINLSLILTENNLCNSNEIKDFFSPNLFKFRFRPYIQTSNGKNNGLSQISKNSMDELKLEFERAGFEVNAWAIPSKTEQEFSIVSTIFRKRYLELTKF